MHHEENQILLTVGSSKSTIVSMIEQTEITSTSTFLQGLFLQYLHKVVNNNVSLQQSIVVSLQNYILCLFFRGISTIMSLQSSLPTYLRNRFLRSSLLTCLRSKFL